MPVSRLPSSSDLDELAGAVRLADGSPPSYSPKATGPRLGPTAFDKHMWRSFETGKYGTVEVPVSKLQDVRVRLARSQRWLSAKYQDVLRESLLKPPYRFKTSLIVTDKDGNKLAEGPVKGNLTSPALDALSPDEIVTLWFRMHLPYDLGTRVRLKPTMFPEGGWMFLELIFPSGPVVLELRDCLASWPPPVILSPSVPPPSAC